MAVGYPGGANTVIPLFDLSGNLMVAYGRNQKDFAVNRYQRVTPVKSKVGNYLRFNPNDLVRATGWDQSTNWPEGQPRPTGSHETLGFETFPFRTERKAFPITLDREAVDIASYPVMKTHTAVLGQRAMTYRAWRASTALTTTANFPATHVDSATTFGGGFLSGGTTSDPRIKIAFDTLAREIMKSTFGAVKWGQLSVLMNHNTALRLSQTREIREYVMQHEQAYKSVRLDADKNYNAAYGLPDMLYGFKVVVEDAFYNTANRANTSETGTVVYPDNTITMFLADGDLEQPEGATSYSTCHAFTFEEMTLETKDDAWDRIVHMSCVMNLDVQIVAPPTGGIITNVFS